MIDESIEYYTVVYAVSKDHRREWLEMILPMFLARDMPIHVETIARGDAIEERDAYQERVV